MTIGLAHTHRLSDNYNYTQISYTIVKEGNVEPLCSLVKKGGCVKGLILLLNISTQKINNENIKMIVMRKYHYTIIVRRLEFDRRFAQNLPFFLSFAA